MSKETSDQPAGTGNNGNNPPRTRAGRRIDARTISEIAKLCARQLTESEACRKIGIKPRHWFSWKSRHKRAEKFAALLEAFRADRIDDLITKIEASADGTGLKQPDWRAAAFLLTVTDKQRFGPQAAEVQVNMPPQIPLADIQRAIAIALSRFNAEKQPAVEAPPAPKQIQDAEVLPDAKQ